MTVYEALRANIRAGLIDHYQAMEIVLELKRSLMKVSILGKRDASFSDRRHTSENAKNQA